MEYVLEVDKNLKLSRKKNACMPLEKKPLRIKKVNK
jgi:hypothetical protein